jgi:putative transposase
MKTLETLFHSVSESLRLVKQLFSYLRIFLSAFFRQHTSLGCELVALRSQLTFYKESIRQKKQPRPRFTPAFRLLWVWLSTVWSGWKPVANLMKPRTVLKWHEDAFLQWWRWKSRPKGGRPAISQEVRTLIRRLSRENVLWSAETIYGHLVLLGFDPPCPDTIRKYMVKLTGGTDKSQSWLTFLRNHVQVSWAMDFFSSYDSLSNPLCLCRFESLAPPGGALRSDGASDDGLGDPATAGSDAVWLAATLYVS